MNQPFFSSWRRVAGTALAGLAGAATAAGPAFAAGAADEVRSVGVDHGSLVVRTGQQPPQTLVSGGAARALPVWSPDGARVAFVQATDKRRSLADLVVVSAGGVELMRVAIEPVVADTAYAGMRFVEGVRWASPDRLAVWGSLNPSQSQYYIVDVAAAQVVDDFIDDRSSAAFAPGGQHVAYQSGSPHFGAAGGRAASLFVDGKAVFPQAGQGRMDIVSAPRWSADGRSLATLAQDAGRTTTRLVVWRDGVTRDAAVAPATADTFNVVWSGEKLFLTATKAGQEKPTLAWAADAVGTSVKSVSPATAADPLAPARAMRERLASEALANGLSQADFWCAACALHALPRSTD